MHLATDRPEIRLTLIAAAITAAEIIVFALIGKVAELPLSKLFVDRFSDLVISVATTWYVVFTYGLLSSAERSRRSKAEPYLTVSWEASSKASAASH